MSTFSDNLKLLRKKNKMTQQALAEAVHVSQNAIYNWENGKREPSLDMVIKLAHELDADIFDLIEVPFEPFTNSVDFKPHPDKDNILNDVYTADLLDAFNKLNDSGKQRAVSQVQLVASVPEFRKVIRKRDVNTTPTLNAAHERTDVEITDDMLEHDEKLMDEED